MGIDARLNVRIAFPTSSWELEERVFDIISAFTTDKVYASVASLCIYRRRLKYHDVKFEKNDWPRIDEIKIDMLNDRNFRASITIKEILCEKLSKKWSNAKCKNFSEFCKTFKCIIEWDEFCYDRLHGMRTIYGTDGKQWLAKEFSEEIEFNDEGDIKAAANLAKDDCYKKTFDEVVVENEFATQLINFDLNDFNQTFRA